MFFDKVRVLIVAHQNRVLFMFLAFLEIVEAGDPCKTHSQSLLLQGRLKLFLLGFLYLSWLFFTCFCYVILRGIFWLNCRFTNPACSKALSLNIVIITMAPFHHLFTIYVVIFIKAWKLQNFDSKIVLALSQYYQLIFYLFRFASEQEQLFNG